MLSGTKHANPGAQRLSDGTLLRSLIDVERREVSLRVHHDSEIFELEMEKIFARSWIPVAHESEIPHPGDYVRRNLGQDSCLVVRAEDGSIAVLLNACSHRGMALCRDEKGSAQQFKCPYHGWAYSKAGTFLGAPFEKPMYGNTLRLQPERLALTNAKVATLGGMVFGNWDLDAESFDNYLGDFGWYLRAALERSNRGMEVLGPPQRHIMRANWKLLAEQLADGYHARTLHACASDMGLFGHENTPESWALTGINVSTPGGHTLRCIDAKTTYKLSGGNPNASIAERLAQLPPPGADRELTQQFPRQLTEGQMRLLVDTPPMVMGLFPGTDFFGFMSQDGTGDGKYGPVMVARGWTPRGPDLFEMLSWVMVERDASEELRERTRRTSIRQFGISGMIEQDDAEAWAGIQRTAAGPMGRKLNAKYHATLGIVRPEDFEGGGDVHAGISRDDVQWAWWKRYFEVMSA
jgi:phenylpropionate dioxygenase-like ring-hydroxylating dioxygenase large terminal subunit